ncbi:MAG: septum formation initiator family protein [Alistipes sp.]|nr:septum formation initiator family protein [Candidatus Alistipes equi]
MNKEIVAKIKSRINKHSTTYWICSAVVCFFVCTAITTMVNTAVHLYRYHCELNQIEKEKKELLAEIANDSIKLELLKRDDYLEHFARERFHLIKKGETIYVEENSK